MSLQFSGKRALDNIIAQVNLGPRIPGSLAHSEAIKLIDDELIRSGWQVFLQNGIIQRHAITNIIAKRSNIPPRIIIAAHYDSRLLSDRDPITNQRSDPVPGANDGASGVSVLLELANSLQNINNKSIWLVFLDAEDNGNIPGWDWLLGSKYFVSELKTKPRAVLIIDMVGDKDLNIFIEKNSYAKLSTEIWKAAKSLGNEKYFINIAKYSILDDHIPFIDAGIPAVDIIDIDYPYWHTTEDTIDKVSENSLEIVGSTLLYWILQQR